MQTCSEEKPTAPSMPADFLREWIRKGTLVSLIIDAAQTVEWPESELQHAARSGGQFRNLATLTVLIYCHAFEVYDAKDIAAMASEDEILRLVCAGSFPTARQLEEFRHRNRDLIRRTVIQTCKSAADHRLETAPGALPADKTISCARTRKRRQLT